MGAGHRNVGKGSRAGAGVALGPRPGCGSGQARAGCRGTGDGGVVDGLNAWGGMAEWWMGWMLGVGGGGIAWGRWVWEWIWLEPRGAR